MGFLFTFLFCLPFVVYSLSRRYTIRENSSVPVIIHFFFIPPQKKAYTYFGNLSSSVWVDAKNKRNSPVAIEHHPFNERMNKTFLPIYISLQASEKERKTNETNMWHQQKFAMENDYAETCKCIGTQTHTHTSRLVIPLDYCGLFKSAYNFGYCCCGCWFFAYVLCRICRRWTLLLFATGYINLVLDK